MKIQDGNGGSDSYTLVTESPSPINFGNVPQSTSTTAKATVRCVASTGLQGTVTAISVSGAAFTLTGLPALPKFLANGASFSFTVTVNTAALGAAVGTISITWEGIEGGVITVPLNATIVVTNIAVTPAVLDFGNVVINTPQAGITPINVKNNTGGTIHLTAAAFSNPDFTWLTGSVPI